MCVSWKVTTTPRQPLQVKNYKTTEVIGVELQENHKYVAEMGFGIGYPIH